MEWTKITDNPPKKGEDAIFTNEKVNNYTEQFMWTFGFYVSGGKFTSYTTRDLMPATQYMIPQPPKQEQP